MSNGWPMVVLGELLAKSDERIDLQLDKTYSEVTVRLWGRGVTERGKVTGAHIAAGKRLAVHAGEFILSRIDARNGAFGLIPQSLDGAVVSSDFPVFRLDTRLIVPKYLEWMSKTADFVDLCRTASEGTTNRVRLKEERFLSAEIPLPPLDEQRRIVARIEELAAKISQVLQMKRETDNDIKRLLMSAYHRISDRATRKPMGEVAPLIRRPANINRDANYPQIAVRSFGKGTFHKPPLAGSEVTWQKPYLVKAGDILISNIKAWEGAIAVASEVDDGRFGSHRYLTCVPIPGVATSRFVCFHLLAPHGLHDIGEASPGSADRNRTLSSEALRRIPIPIPPFEEQLWFDGLCQKVDALKHLQAETAAELDALLPAVLDRAFKGEL
ncbi:MAG: restriction endonuclease subunit S [Chloroflexi bacterium]|nr:restriction endonuclease subunit S [Chloroflexota bacterium]